MVFLKEAVFAVLATKWIVGLVDQFRSWTMTAFYVAISLVMIALTLGHRIDAVNLKYRLRNIDPDRANFAHGRLPSMWLRFDATTLWHSDAAEWAPSTASFASLPGRAKIGLCPLHSVSDGILRCNECSDLASTLGIYTDLATCL